MTNVCRFGVGRSAQFTLKGGETGAGECVCAARAAGSTVSGGQASAFDHGKSSAVAGSPDGGSGRPAFRPDDPGRGCGKPHMDRHPSTVVVTGQTFDTAVLDRSA